MVVIDLGLGVLCPRVKDTFYEPDNYIGWKLIPSKKEGRTVVGKVVLDPKITSNGFREEEHSFNKGKGVFRIVVLGDSFCDQLEMPFKQLWHRVLERRLNSGSTEPIEVINLGIGGFGTDQEYKTLKNYGLKYHPDLVVLAFFIGNDVRNNSLILESEHEGRSVDDRQKPFFLIIKDKLEELPFQTKPQTTEAQTPKTLTLGRFFEKFPNIYHALIDRANETPWLANFLWKLDIKRSKPNWFHKSKKNLIFINDDYIYAEEYTRVWENAWEVTKALILELAKELELNKIGFFMVIIPNEFEFRPDIWYKMYPNMKPIKPDLQKPERILSKFLEANQIDHILLRPEFEKYTRTTRMDLHFHREGDNHWNANGHEISAQLIYKRLIDYKLVPKREKINNEHS